MSARTAGIIMSLLLICIPAIGIVQQVKAYKTIGTRVDVSANPQKALNMNPESIGAQGPGYYETSEYFIGKVACDIIFIESNGVTDPNTEDWASVEKSTARSATVQAIQWWTAQAPNGCVQWLTGAAYSRYTNYEPISRPSTDEYLWISEAVTNQPGYPSDPEQYIELVYAYVNGRRNAVGSDWFFLFFMIDSSNDADGCFADGMFAYAYLGGPFIVMTYTNDGYGSGDLARTASHEIGHIFYATDENDGITENSGYLNVADVEGFNGVMYGEGPFDWAISPGTWGQVGWCDSDNDTIQDIVDTFPNTILNPYSPDPTDNTILAYTGTVTETPYPNDNPYGTGRDITVNTIVNVQFRVDSGPWMNATSDDGSFNETEESFSFVTPVLPPGTHTIETRGINSVGNAETTYALDTVTTKGHDVSITNISLSKTAISQGLNLDINVTVKNQGDYEETFNIIIYANATEIGTQTITNLPADTTQILTFTFNTTAFAYGNYRISANTSIVDSDLNTTNNVLVDGWIAVTISGDINGDSAVTLADLVLLAIAYGSRPNDAEWNPNADINGDGVVSLTDLVLLANSYGQSYP